MNDRAVSSTLNYVLSLSIASLLVTGLLIAGGGFVQDQQERVLRSELSVVGQQVASDINRADRLLTAGRGDTTVEINQSFPSRITGTAYKMSLDPGDGELVLQSVDPEVTVAVHVQTRRGLSASFADGGTVVVRNTTSGKLEIDNG